MMAQIISREDITTPIIFLDVCFKGYDKLIFQPLYTSIHRPDIDVAIPIGLYFTII